MNIPTFEHADVTLNSYGRANITAHEGYVMCDMHDYEHLTDEDGNPREPLPEEISYFRAFYNLPLSWDFTKIIIVPESEVPENQIFGEGNNTEVM